LFPQQLHVVHFIHITAAIPKQNIHIYPRRHQRSKEKVAESYRFSIAATDGEARAGSDGSTSAGTNAVVNAITHVLPGVT